MQSKFYKQFGKRLFDIIGACIGLIILLPLFFIISILIKITSKGNVFFLQERIGKYYRPIRVVKFRTMHVNTSLKQNYFEPGNAARITKLGRILRKTKLDEIPQLINVFKGDMSIVGPRPEVKDWTEVYSEKWDLVLSVRPGMTDYAAVFFRNEEDILFSAVDPIEVYKNEILPQKINLYLEYIENQSFYTDFSIILKTLKVVILK